MKAVKTQQQKEKRKNQRKKNKVTAYSASY